MTDTPDWADVIADDIWDDHVMEYEPKFGRSLIADALRKAKAAGLREAAEIADARRAVRSLPVLERTERETRDFEATCKLIADNIAIAIRAAADKLERGE